MCLMSSSDSKNRDTHFCLLRRCSILSTVSAVHWAKQKWNTECGKSNTKTRDFIPDVSTVATFRLALRWMCDSPRTGVSEEQHPYIYICMWRKQAIIEWLRRMISIVACCRSVKLCSHAARAFRSQQYQSCWNVSPKTNTGQAPPLGLVLMSGRFNCKIYTLWRGDSPHFALNS